jgi:hypothetical protein
MYKYSLKTNIVLLEEYYCWNVTPCSLVEVYLDFGGTASIFRVEE